MDHINREKTGILKYGKKMSLFYRRIPFDYKDSCDISTFYKTWILQNSSQKYVLVSGSNLVYNMNYDKVLRFHQNTGAEIDR